MKSVSVSVCVCMKEKDKDKQNKNRKMEKRQADRKNVSKIYLACDKNAQAKLKKHNTYHRNYMHKS